MSNAGEKPVKATGGRIVGLDIARAFAIVGMVIVNFKITMSAETSGPQWLRTFAALFDGRAAATFVILAGIGASLGSRRARENGDQSARRAAQMTLAKRGLFEGPPVVRSPRLGGDHDRKQSGAATGTTSAFVHRGVQG